MSKQHVKRNLFAELTQGIEEISNYKKTKKITLRTYKVEKKPHLKVTATLIRHTRQQLHMSRPVFALKLRVSPRTLEKWEQGETKPNDQAAALILMVSKFPDTLKRLEEI
jgi:putative transcriptional regulator